MKLIKCYIENFGKLHRFEYNFKDGLNIINEENGFGKTTFANFIKAMFYGLDSGTNAKVENSERKLYMPWQGGLFGGNVEIEIDGKQYKIERFFGKKQSEDTFKIYDLSTNLESFDYTENIGEELFKINKEGYERSTYIPQEKIQIEMEDSLNAKLSNILENENDINNSDDALKILSDTRKIYQKDRGKGGLLDEKKEKLNLLERELENSKSDSENLEAKRQKLNDIEAETKNINSIKKEKEDMLSKKIEQDRKEAKRETYNTIINRYKSTNEKIEELNTFFENEVPEEFKGNNIKDNTIKKLKNYKITILMTTIIFLILVITGIILISSKANKIIGIILTIISVFCFIADIIVYLKEIKLRHFKIEYDSFNKLLEIKENENSKLKEEFEDINAEKERFERENNIEDLNNITDLSYISEEELKSQIMRINTQIDNLMDEKNQIKNQIETLENKMDEDEYLESDIENLKLEINDLTDRYNILSKTEDLLKSAKNSFSSRYLQKMSDGFEHYLNLIDNKNIDTDVDINLNVQINSNGSQHDVKFYSRGYKDLIYLCMRFSLIDTLFKSELPFVILDDPFVNLDEEKTSNILKMIDEFSKKYQVIYLVCNSNRIK